jgi:hypothetical protein
MSYKKNQTEAKETKDIEKHKQLKEQILETNEGIIVELPDPTRFDLLCVISLEFRALQVSLETAKTILPA